MNFHKKKIISHGNSFTGNPQPEIPRVCLMATSKTCTHDMAIIVLGFTNMMKG